MNGPAHWREAERLIRRPRLSDSENLIVTPSPEVIALAQVHATLALTAATLARGSVSMTLADRHEWLTAIDPEYAAGRPCRAHPDDCPNGPGPHAYYNPPELEGRCPCCVQPGESAQPSGGTS